MNPEQILGLCTISFLAGGYCAILALYFIKGE